MGLKYTSSPKARRVAASMISLALFVQILGGLLYPAVAQATTMTTVSPNDLRGWHSVDEAGNGGAVRFVNSQGSMGSGSTLFDLTASGQTQIFSVSSYDTTKLSTISTLGYSSYVQGPASTVPLLRFSVDTNVTDADAAAQSDLVYSPNKNGPTSVDAWQFHDARAGLWWFSDTSVSGGVCGEATPCTLDMIITLYPDIGIAGEISLVSANMIEPSRSNIDGFIFNEDAYNFEAVGSPQLASPSNGESSGGSLTSTWQSVPGAVGYVYESYVDSAATQIRESAYTTETTHAGEGLSKGTTVWWRVKAVDAHGDEGAWSELWKVTIVVNDETTSVGSGVIGGGDSGKTEDLIAQLVRLNEPLAVPLDAVAVSSMYGATDETGGGRDDGILRSAAADRPVISQEAKPTAVVAPSENGWKFFGILWYWWVIPLAAAVTFMLRTVRALRETRSFLYSSDQI